MRGECSQCYFRKWILKVATACFTNPFSVPLLQTDHRRSRPRTRNRRPAEWRTFADRRAHASSPTMPAPLSEMKRRAGREGHLLVGGNHVTSCAAARCRFPGTSSEACSLVVRQGWHALHSGAREAEGSLCSSSSLVYGWKMSRCDHKSIKTTEKHYAPFVKARQKSMVDEPRGVWIKTGENEDQPSVCRSALRAPLRSRSHRKDLSCGSLKLEPQNPFTRNIPTINFRRCKFPTGGSLQRQVSKILARSWRIERLSHHAA